MTCCRLRFIDVLSFGSGIEPNVVELDDGEIRALASSPNGSKLAYTKDSAPYCIYVHDTVTATTTELTGHSAVVEDVNFSADGSTIWSTSVDKTVRQWDVQTRQQLRALNCRYQCHRFALTNDNELWAAMIDGAVKSFDLSSTKRTRSEFAHQTVFGSVPGDAVGTPAISPDEQYIAYVTSPNSNCRKTEQCTNTVRIARVSDTTKFKTLGAFGENEFFGSLLFIDNRHLAATTLSGKARIVDIQTETLRCGWQAHSPQTNSQHWLPDVCPMLCRVNTENNWLATYTVRLDNAGRVSQSETKYWDWNAERAHPLEGWTSPRTNQPYNLLWISPHNPICATAFRYPNAKVGVLNLYSAKTGAPLKSFSDAGVAFHPQHTHKFVIHSTGGNVRLVDSRDYSEIDSFQAHDGALTDCAFLPDGSRLVTSSSGTQMVRLWDPTTNRRMLNLSAEGRRAYLRVSDLGNVILAHEVDGRIHVWQAPTWEDIESR